MYIYIYIHKAFIINIEIISPLETILVYESRKIFIKTIVDDLFPGEGDKLTPTPKS